MTPAITWVSRGRTSTRRRIYENAAFACSPATALYSISPWRRRSFHFFRAGSSGSRGPRLKIISSLKSRSTSNLGRRLPATTPRSGSVSPPVSPLCICARAQADADPSIKRKLPDYLLNQNPNDVRFTFAGTELELWVSSAVLKNASPYFETLVSGSFKEAQFTHVRDGRLMVSHITSDCDVLEDSDDDMDGNPDDSDDETDKVFKDQRRSLAKPRSRHVTPHKNVVVKDTAYTTYASVLLCLATRSIRFAQLRSAPEQTRLADLTAANEANPGLPLPASPKSVYRLAHLLELGDLRAVALDEFFSRLQVENAAVELFSDTAGVYPLLFANMRRLPRRRAGRRCKPAPTVASCLPDPPPPRSSSPDVSRSEQAGRATIVVIALGFSPTEKQMDAGSPVLRDVRKVFRVGTDGGRRKDACAVPAGPASCRTHTCILRFTRSLVPLCWRDSRFESVPEPHLWYPGLISFALVL